MRASNLVLALASAKYAVSIEASFAYFIGEACHGDYAGRDYYKSGLGEGCYDVEPSAGSVVVTSKDGHILVDGWSAECQTSKAIISQDLKSDCINLAHFNGQIKKLSIGPTEIGGKRDEPVLPADRMNMQVSYTGEIDNIAAGQWTIDEQGNMLVGLGDGIVMEVDRSEHDSRGNFHYMEYFQQAMNEEDSQEHFDNTTELSARSAEIYGYCTTAVQCTNTFLRNSGDAIRKGYTKVLGKIPNTGPLSAFKDRTFYGGVAVASLPYIAAKIGGSGDAKACGAEKGWQEYLKDLAKFVTDAEFSHQTGEYCVSSDATHVCFAWGTGKNKTDARAQYCDKNVD